MPSLIRFLQRTIMTLICQPNIPKNQKEKPVFNKQREIFLCEAHRRGGAGLPHR